MPENLNSIYEEIKQQDYYKRLDIVAKFTEEQIKKNYKALALKFHPDKHPAEDDKKITELIFGLIHDAFATLSVPELRKQYDLLNRNGLGNLPDQHEYRCKDSFSFCERAGGISHLHISDNFAVLDEENGNGIGLYFNRTGDRFKTYSRSNNYEVYYRFFVAEEENKIFATHSSGDIDAFDITSGELLTTYPTKIKNEYTTKNGVILIDSNRILTYNSCSVTEFSMDGNSQRSIECGGKSAEIRHVDLSKNKQYIVVTHRCSIELLHLKTGKSLKRIDVNEFTVNGAVISPDCKLVAYRGYNNNNGKAILHNLITDTQTIIPIDSGSCIALHFSSNNKYLAIGCYPSTYFIYAIEENKIISSGVLSGFIHNLYFTNNNRLIVNAGYAVYNLRLPSNIKTNSHAIGDNTLAIQHFGTETNETPNGFTSVMISPVITTTTDLTASFKLLPTSTYPMIKVENGELGKSMTGANAHYASEPDVLDAHRESLIAKLQKYINQFENNKTESDGQIKFGDNFWFFRNSRAINQQADYLLAKYLLEELSVSPKSPLNLVFSSIEEKREEILKNKGLTSHPDYVKRALHCAELIAILKEAQKYIIIEKSQMLESGPKQTRFNAR